jgi:hypothetical protein
MYNIVFTQGIFMKIWAFIKWNFNRLDFLQKVYMFGAGCLGWAITSPKNSTEEFAAYSLACSIFVIIFFKWFIWDIIKHNYEKFQTEQQNLFDTVKHSDK